MKTLNTLDTKFKFSSLTKIRALPIMMVYFAVMGFFMISAPRVFTRPLIYGSFLQTVPPQLVLALGLTLVITAGEIDLSFSAVIAFSGFVFAFFFRTFNAPWLALILALGAGALVGFINGLMISKLKVPSIMATLAAQFFWNGLTVLLCGGLSWNIKEIRGTLIHNIFTYRVLGFIPMQAIWSLGLTIFIWFILNRHKFGEAVMFIGDNENVARVMGINVENKKIQLFTINGLIAGFAAVLLTLEMINFWSTQGASFLLPVMAAVFIGGTSIAGGEGLVMGTFFGAYIIGSLEAGVVATGIGGFWVRIVEGLVMAGSVILNIFIKGKGGKIAGRFKAFRISLNKNRAAK
jgi:simple sugar transport system permease protein